MRQLIALVLVVAAMPATSFAQVSFDAAQASDRPRPPVAVILEPSSTVAIPRRPPIGYPRLPGAVPLPPRSPFAQPVFVPPPPRPVRPISLRAHVVTGMAAGLVFGAVLGLPAASASCDIGPRATGPCRAGSAGVGVLLGGAVGALSWLRGQ